MIHVEVVFALPHEQRVFTLVVNKHATVEEIIAQSGVLDHKRSLKTLNMNVLKRS